MKAIAADMLESPLPPDDGLIDQALRDLDAKVSAFCKAVSSAQGALRRLASNQQDQAEHVQRMQTTQASSPTAPAPPDCTADSGSSKPVFPHFSQQPASAVAEAPPRPSSLTEEDEALLASLDEQTAERIRIRRRLRGGRVSIRQLLQEDEQLQSSPAAKQIDKKSWWRK